MTERGKNILIGLFITAALCVAVVIVLFLKPTIGDGRKSIKVRFSNITGIHTGTRVTYAGRPIGEVAAIEEVPNARLDPDESGKIYSFQLVLRVDSSISVFISDEIAIRTTGLMGEKSIAIIPKASQPGIAPQLVRDQILYANSIDPFDHTLTQISRMTAKIEHAFVHIDDWFQQIAPALTASATHFNKATHSLHSLLSECKEFNLAGSLNHSLNLFSENMKKIDEENFIQKISSLVQNLQQSVMILNTNGATLVKNLTQLTGDLNQGTGTISRFIKGDDFYLRLNSLMSKSEILMNDINHYGLLFQYNKQWQKTRTKKIHLLNALDSPQDFKTYFEGELDSIGTSLGRISALLERAEEQPERERMMKSDSFKKDFVVLLRQVQALNETLKLYNQELVSKETQNID